MGEELCFRAGGSCPDGCGGAAPPVFRSGASGKSGGMVLDCHPELRKRSDRGAEWGGKDAAGAGIPGKIPQRQTASSAKRDL